MGWLLGVEPRLTGPQPAVLPLNYRHHIFNFQFQILNFQIIFNVLIFKFKHCFEILNL